MDLQTGHFLLNSTLKGRVMPNRKYIFVVGGVMSSVGKGVTAASIGLLLKSRGYSITNVKCEMYVNIDAGTIRPTEHGEVFVGLDGIEADQDLGNYERFTSVDTTSMNFITQGQVWQEVIRKERNLEYDGEDVEVVPDIPNEIIRRIEAAAEHHQAQITIIELGGTIGEYQISMFLEAARMMKQRGPSDVAFVMVSYLPIPKMVGEMKTKPTQNAAHQLNSAGILADFIVCRAEKPLDEPRRQRLALLCNVPADGAISAPDVSNIYEVPIGLEQQELDVKLLQRLGLDPKERDLAKWRELVHRVRAINRPVNIAIVGKYFGTGHFTLADSYISVIEATKHASWANGVAPKFTWVDSEKFENHPEKAAELKDFDGIIVPGGFGSRGIEGIITAIEFARQHRIPYLGLCYGMQLATIEFARHIAKLDGAHTTEVDDDAPHPVIHIMPDQEKKLLQLEYGGTMRLGAYPCKLKEGSVTAKAYEAQRSTAEAPTGAKEDGTPHSADSFARGADDIVVSERHRHRYEFNNQYREELENAGLVIAGTSPDDRLVEVIELPKSVHPFFVGTQYHPEFQSRPLTPHPLFRAFIAAAIQTQ
jgi:CTP synthase